MAKYNYQGGGNDFISTAWYNQFYGGPIFNGVYSCDIAHAGCTSKPNNLKYEMENAKSDKEFHGYFKFENLPYGNDESIFIDIEFFTRITDKDWHTKLM